MNDINGRVLVLAPDEQLATAILAALREAAPNAKVDLAHSLEEAQQIVVSQRPDLFVLDIDATYDLGQEFLYDLRTSHPNARAIVLTAVHLAQQRERAAGIGAIHFLEKPFPHGDFVTLVEALLQPAGDVEERFQGKLSDLHIADIIQLKCMSGATSALEFTGPRGEKARVFFDNGQVRHATAPGREGVNAFNEIVSWKGGMISEVSGAGEPPRTVDIDWQVLLMEAVRKIDEDRGTASEPAAATHAPTRRKILVIDDSIMLLNFVKEILTEDNYDAVAAATAEEGLRAAAEDAPDLILLDYVLPDMKGDEVLRHLLKNDATAKLPVVYMSGFGTDLPSDPTRSSNVIGSLNKPFTSELLLKTVKQFMPAEEASIDAPPSSQSQTAMAEAEPEIAPEPEQGNWGSMPAWNAPQAQEFVPEPGPTFAAEPVSEWNAPAPLQSQSEQAETAVNEAAAGGGSGNDAWWNAAPPAPAWTNPAPETGDISFASDPSPFAPPAQQHERLSQPATESAPANENAFFCGDTSFFSLSWALHAIGDQKLTGILRAYWDKEHVELLARDGQIVLVTTHDPELYCEEAPITLVNIDQERTLDARQQQRETGRPLFITLADQELIIREPALQLVQHYGQKLFAQLWCANRVRFMFEQSETMPAYAAEVPGEEDIDHWALSTLRFVQYQDLGNRANYDPSSIPAYTRNGFERVQKLRLTVAEAQFASQFNGARSIAQIAKNLRLDLKFARVTLFRFIALEIVECWPPAVAVKQEKRGVFGRIFGE
ncbi:MAG: response regulator [Verrucomicrobiota bacterium]|nr:response regulator [Verrucomicrobiota bacterium]